jgi:hypothetical protein
MTKDTLETAVRGTSRPLLLSEAGLALALVHRCKTKHGPQYAEVVDREISAPEKLRQIAAIFEQGLKNQRPCLLAALGSSMNTLPSTAIEDPGRMDGKQVSALTRVGLSGRFSDLMRSEIAISNIDGQLIATLREMTSGVYLYRIEADGFSQTGRMVLLK